MENGTFIPRNEPVLDTTPALPAVPLPPRAPLVQNAPLVMPSGPFPGTPSPKAQSWGAVISIIIIMLMIIVGAFYAWGKRIAQENALIAPAAEQ